MTPNPAAEPEELLPIHPVQLSILLVLRTGPLHGYGIMKRVNDQFGRRELVGPGTLYRTLKEMREAGLIEPTDPPPNEEDVDGRRQYYRLSERGEDVVEAEARRLVTLLHEARLDDLAPESGAGS